MPQLEAGSNRFAQLLRALGIRAGDHIAFFVENHPRFFDLCWGAKRAGLYYTAISSFLTAEEVAYIVNDCGARLFVSTEYMRDAAVVVPPLCPKLEHCLLIDGAADGFACYEDAVAAQPESRIADEVDGTDMLYSSGTTGRPKAVKRPLQGTTFGTPEPALAMLADAVGLHRGHGLPVAGAALSRRPAALQHGLDRARRDQRRSWSGSMPPTAWS